MTLFIHFRTSSGPRRSEAAREVHCEALEQAAQKMTKGSAAVVSVEDPSICQDAKLGPNNKTQKT